MVENHGLQKAVILVPQNKKNVIGDIVHEKLFLNDKKKKKRRWKEKERGERERERERGTLIGLSVGGRRYIYFDSGN